MLCRISNDIHICYRCCYHRDSCSLDIDFHIIIEWAPPVVGLPSPPSYIRACLLHNSSSLLLQPSRCRGLVRARRDYRWFQEVRFIGSWRARGKALSLSTKGGHFLKLVELHTLTGPRLKARGERRWGCDEDEPVPPYSVSVRLMILCAWFRFVLHPFPRFYRARCAASPLVKINGKAMCFRGTAYIGCRSDGERDGGKNRE